MPGFDGSQATENGRGLRGGASEGEDGRVPNVPRDTGGPRMAGIIRRVAAVLVMAGGAMAFAPVAANPRILIVESGSGDINETDRQRFTLPVTRRLRALLGPAYVIVEGSDLVDAVHRDLSLPDTRLSPFDEASLRRALDEAIRLVRRGEDSDGVATAARALARLRDHPGAVIANSALRDAEYRALVFKAVAHDRLARAASDNGMRVLEQENARTAVREIIRGFPGRTPSGREFPTRAMSLYREGLQLNSGTCTLVVQTADRDAAIYINEGMVGVGPMVGRSLIPGVYRIYVKWSNGSARWTRVHLAPGAVETIYADTSLGPYLRSRGRVTLHFPSLVERERDEDRYVRALMTLSGVEIALVIGMDSEVREAGGLARVRGLHTAFWFDDTHDMETWESADHWRGPGPVASFLAGAILSRDARCRAGKGGSYTCQVE